MLLAVVDNWSGLDLWDEFDRVATDYDFETPKVYSADSVEELLAMDPGDGSAEGFVLVWENKRGPSPRLKLKFESWLAAKTELFAQPLQ